MRVTKKVEGFILEEVKKRRADGRPQTSEETERQEAAIEALEKSFISQILEIESKFGEAIKKIVGDENDTPMCRFRQTLYDDRNDIDVNLESSSLEKEKNKVCNAKRKYDGETAKIADELCARMEMGGDWETLQRLISEL